MTPYHLWHPHRIAPTTVRAWLTLGQALFLGRGTADLAAAVCGAMGTRGEIVEWRCDVVRTNYFCAYRFDPSCWQERWQLAWRMTCTLDREVERPRVPRGESIELHAVDASFSMDDRPDQWPEIECVVLADARDPGHADALAGLGGEVAAERGLAFGRYPSLAFDLGVRPISFFADGAAPAEALVDALAAAGASTHRFTTRDWRDGVAS